MCENNSVKNHRIEQWVYDFFLLHSMLCVVDRLLKKECQFPIKQVVHFFFLFVIKIDDES